MWKQTFVTLSTASRINASKLKCGKVKTDVVATPPLILALRETHERCASDFATTGLGWKLQTDLFESSTPKPVWIPKNA